MRNPALKELVLKDSDLAFETRMISNILKTDNHSIEKMDIQHHSSLFLKGTAAGDLASIQTSLTRNAARARAATISPVR
jgi:hypothetical protein